MVGEYQLTFVRFLQRAEYRDRQAIQAKLERIVARS
jgi:low affinity Fe/Cu permease